MLPAASRLRRRDDFAAAVRQGRRAGRSRLVVHLVQAPALVPAEPTRPRAGFIVNRSVGGAVERNRVRRQLRHLTARRLPDLPLGSRLVVRALPPAAGASSSALGADLDAALARVSPRPAGATAEPARGEVTR